MTAKEGECAHSPVLRARCRQIGSCCDSPDMKVMAGEKTDFSSAIKSDPRNAILWRAKKQAETIELVRKVVLLLRKHVFHALAAPKCQPPF